MIKHFFTVFSPPAKSSSNLCRHKLIRSTEICKQRTVSSTLVSNPPTWYTTAQVKYQTHTFHLSPSSSAPNGLLAYLVPHLNYNWVKGSGAPLSTEMREGGDLSGGTSLQTYGLRESNQKAQEKNPVKNPPSPALTATLLPTQPPSALHRSAYVVTNDTFIFLQSLCVCKTAEVHQDVKYFGWATQVALEDNQMEV